MMSEWDSDPELRALREEFIDSLAPRLALLEEIIRRLKDEPGEAVLEELCFVVHKLSGVAANYGFPGLTEASGALEDWLSGARARGPLDFARVGRYAALLRDLLRECHQARGESPGFSADPRLMELLLGSS